MFLREQTRRVWVGGVPVGGGAPVVIESMTNTATADADKTVRQICELAQAGCEIVRVGVPNEESAVAIREIKPKIPIPLIADIHFDHRLAILALKHGADKLRINPGNIGDASKVREVVRAAKAAGVPIRVGVNSGSLEKEILAKHDGVTPQGLAESAEKNVRLLESADFDNIVVSMKTTSAPDLIEATKIFAGKHDYPLHLGLTEAGTQLNGTIRSAAALGALLALGLGDTVRVSLSADPIHEIHAAKQILAAMQLRRFGITVIACPMCARTSFDISTLATNLEQKLAHIKTPMTLAVMGCEVNGPGEARMADIGVSAGKNRAAIFKKGKIIKTVHENEVEDMVLEMVLLHCANESHPIGENSPPYENSPPIKQ